MAMFCLLTKMQPSEYRSLTLRERRAFTRALKIVNGQDPDDGDGVEVEWDGD